MKKAGLSGELANRILAGFKWCVATINRAIAFILSLR